MNPPSYFLQFPDRPYRAEADDRQYRRGVYVHWQRTFLHPMLANFDAPSREEFVARRDAGEIDDEVLRRVLHELDLEEAALDRDARR